MIKRVFLIGLLSLLFTPSLIFAVNCGRIPVYCLMEVDRTEDHKSKYYETMPIVAACIQTTYVFGNVSPMCKIRPINKTALMSKCKELYPDEPNERVVGITYYKGGDPVSPLSKTNVTLWGNSYYKVTDILVDSTNPSVKGMPLPGCDIHSDAI